MEDNNKESKGNKIFKKGIKFLAIALLILVLGGIGGVATERYVFPKLSSYDFFSKFDFIKKTNENVTVINKTEKVMVQEEDSINKIASQAETTVVNIISVPDNTSSIESASQNGTGVIVTGDGYVVTYRDAILETDASYKILPFLLSIYEQKDFYLQPLIYTFRYLLLLNQEAIELHGCILWENGNQSPLFLSNTV